MRGQVIGGLNMTDMALAVTMPKERNYIENLMTLMQAIRILEEKPDDWFKSPESCHELSVIYLIEDSYYQSFVIETEEGYYLVKRNYAYTALLSHTFSIMELTDFDIKYGFGIYRKCDNVFEGDFIDACRYILDWKAKDDKSRGL